MGDQRTGSAVAASKATNYSRRTRLWYVGAAVATIAAMLYAAASWMPWVLAISEVAIVGQSGQPQFTMYTVRLTPGDTEGLYGAFTIGASTILGLLIVPWLWLTRGWRSRAIAAALFVLWAWVPVDMVPVAYPLRDSATLTDGLRPHELTILSYQQQTGFRLAFAAAMVLSLTGFVLLLLGSSTNRRATREKLNAPARQGAEAPIPGAGALTFGLLLLLASVFAVGWAGDNCTATPLLASTCTGLSFNGAEYYGILTHTDLFDPIASLHAIPLLLAGGAALILLALWWRRRVTPGFCLWITLYLAAATCFCLVAVAGVGAISDHAAALGLQAGTWRGQTGAYVAAAGLLVAWLALVSLWYAALRRRDPTAGAIAAARSLPAE